LFFDILEKVVSGAFGIFCFLENELGDLCLWVLGWGFENEKAIYGFC
jgi:hypothetical protein